MLLEGDNQHSMSSLSALGNRNKVLQDGREHILHSKDIEKFMPQNMLNILWKWSNLTYAKTMLGNRKDSIDRMISFVINN